MNGEERNRTPDWDAKVWPSSFSTRRVFREQPESFVDIQRTLNSASEGIDLFLVDSAHETTYHEIEEVKEFCRSVGLGRLRDAAGTRRSAWLDDRSCPLTNSEGVRKYDNPLTETAIYRLLKAPV